MDNNGEIPWSCLAPGGAWKAEIWHTSDETAVLARRLAAASPAILCSIPYLVSNKCFLLSIIFCFAELFKQIGWR
jgi:hypothetical protein